MSLLSPRTFFLLFDRPPAFDAEAVLTAMRSVEPGSDDIAGKGACSDTFLQFDGHMIILLSVPAAMPFEEIDPLIDRSIWARDAKAEMKQHSAHIACRLRSEMGSDATGQIVAMLKLGAALVPYGLTGLIEMEDGIAVPAMALPLLTSASALADARQRIPAGIWTGFEQWLQPDGRVLFRSRGFYRWGKPDLVWIGGPDDAEMARDLFGGLLTYMRDADVVFQPGETAGSGSTMLSFSAMPKARRADEASPALLLVERAPSDL